PGEEALVALPRRAGRGTLTVSAVLAVDTAWAAAGHEVAWGQQIAVVEPPEVTPKRPTRWARDRVLGAGRFDAHGMLVELAGVPVSGPRLVLDRAPTDNDLKQGWPHVGDASAADIFARQGLSLLRPRLVSLTADYECVTTVHGWGGIGRAAAVRTTMRWTTDGRRLALVADAVPEGEWGEYWGRIGLEFVLDKKVPSVAWTGAGPGQAYPDCGQAARHGEWTATVDDLQVPYLRPQECGARTEVSALTLAKGFAIAGEPFAFTVRPWSTAELSAAAH